MAKTKELRVQSTVVSTPSVGVVSQYCDASGILRQVNENSTIYTVGQQWSGNVAAMGGSFTPVLSQGTTGSLTGAAMFLEVTGPSGIRVGFPVWKIV